MSDAVRNPSHYEVIEDVEAIQLIASVFTRIEWKAYCLGNVLKYRLRAGKKDKLEQDIGKADFYKELYELHKHRNQPPVMPPQPPKAAPRLESVGLCVVIEVCEKIGNSEPSSGYTTAVHDMLEAGYHL